MGWRGARNNDTAQAAAAIIQMLAPDVAEGMKREFQFHPPRRWRFDLAWPASKVAVEIDGGQWMPYGGRHARDADREKHNIAVFLGWRVLRFTPQEFERDPEYCISMIRTLIEREREERHDSNI